MSTMDENNGEKMNNYDFLMELYEWAYVKSIYLKDLLRPFK